MFTREYAEALALADHTVLVDVYGPGEQPVEGRGSQQIAQLMAQAGASVHFAASVSVAIAHIAAQCSPGDIVLTLGGEDIRPAGPQLLTQLAKHGTEDTGDGGAACDDASSS